MPGVGLVEKKSYTVVAPPGEFVLESSERLSPVVVAYETYGQLSPSRDNAILILHALTGDAHAAGKYKEDDRLPGWWDPLIGPGRAFDTEKYYVICSNVLGGCYGTTGPGSTDPATGKPYGMRFPLVTIRDMVRVQRELLRHLGVEQLVTVSGGSMGGMQALEWAVTFPEMLRSAIPVAAPGRLSAQGIAYNQVQRLAIMQDPGWQQGDYYPGPGPVNGLGLARMIGTITYKSDISWSFKFGRTFAGKSEADYYRWGSHFEVENYLHYQGRKLVARFDANTYLYLTRAMDLHDVSRGYPSYEDALARARVPVLMVGISSDFLYPTYQQKEVVEIRRRLGLPAYYAEIDSPFGHDAFLIEFAQLERIIKDFLQMLVRG